MTQPMWTLLAQNLTLMLKTYRTCNLTIRFSKHKISIKLFNYVTLLNFITVDAHFLTQRPNRRRSPTIRKGERKREWKR